MSVSHRVQAARTVMSAFALAKNSCPHHVHDTSTPYRLCSHATNDPKEYAFEMTFSTIRYGVGVTKEVGMDLKTMGAKKQNYKTQKITGFWKYAAKNTLVVTDEGVSETSAFDRVTESLKKNDCPFNVFERVFVEPTDLSFTDALEFARAGGYDSFIAVGGGSVIDTAKCASLFAANPKAELLDYTTTPAGKWLHPENPMKPLIAIPTTAGTGSETTSVAVFDLHGTGSKTALRTRLIKPHLALVDPLNVMSMPRFVAIYSGLDVLCHALESYTAKPYNQRTAVLNPKDRPVYQGSNPISDVWSSHALKIMRKYFKRSVEDPSDMEARSQMHLASCYAGVGFGNAGVHLCHGLSYSISGKVKKFRNPDYPPYKPLIPHGLSVAMTAPAVFEFCGPACPERHLRAAEMLGVEQATTKYSNDDAGRVLADQVKKILNSFDVPNGLLDVGFGEQDLDLLTKDAMGSLSALNLAPRNTTEDAVKEIYTKSLRTY